MSGKVPLVMDAIMLKEGDVVTDVSPGAQLRLGEVIMLDYEPGFALVYWENATEPERMALKFLSCPSTRIAA